MKNLVLKERKNQKQQEKENFNKDIKDVTLVTSFFVEKSGRWGRFSMNETI